MKNLLRQIMLSIFLAATYVFVLGLWPNIIETLIYLMSLGTGTPPGTHGGSAG